MQSAVSASQFWGCCWSCSFAGKCSGTANVILLQPCKEECKLPDHFPCIMLWNWIITRPYFRDRKPKTGPCSLAAFSAETRCDRHAAAAQGRELCFLSSPAFGKSCLRWGWVREKHHYLKICGCFTYTLYPPNPAPRLSLVVFHFLKYLHILLSAVYWRLSRQVCSRGDTLRSKGKKK